MRYKMDTGMNDLKEAMGSSCRGSNTHRGKMEKVYRKNGNSTSRGNPYCKKHFIEVYKREPNITDSATIGVCRRCSSERNTTLGKGK